MTAKSPPDYPGKTLGLPDTGPGSLAPMGRRLAALLIDWLIAYGLALLGVEFGECDPLFGGLMGTHRNTLASVRRLRVVVDDL